MQLQEWFDEQAKNKPSSLQKMTIYQHFLDKSHRSISYHKVSYYTRVALFSLGLVVITGTVFYSFIPPSTNPYQIAKTNDAYSTLHQRNGQFVQADTIGEIFFTQGDIEITHAQTHIDGAMLSKDDRVLLAAGAEMHFRVNANIEAKIIGPAEFILEDRGLVDGIQQYVINLLAGDYLEIVSIPVVPFTQELPVEKKSPSTIVVQAPEFILEQVDTQGALDVVISMTDDGKTQIENNGTEVVVKKIVEDKQTFVAVQTNEKVAINGHVEFIEGEVTTLIQDIKDKQLTVTYEIDKGKATQKDINDILVTSTTKRKEILDETAMEQFHLAMSKTFLLRDLTQMQQYYIAGNQSAFLIAYGNLLSKIQRAHITLGVTYTPIAADITTLGTTIATLQAFSTTIDALYYVDPSILQTLNILSTKLTALAAQTFGSSLSGGDDLVNEATIVDTYISDESITSEDTSYEDLLHGLGIQ